MERIGYENTWELAWRQKRFEEERWGKREDENEMWCDERDRDEEDKEIVAECACNTMKNVWGVVNERCLKETEEYKNGN